MGWGRSALLVCLCYLLTALLGVFLSHGVSHRAFFETAASKGDNQEYLQLTRGILSHHLDDPALARSKRLYLGAPLAAAFVSRVTTLDPKYALPLLCWIAAAFSWYLAWRLYGPAAAALLLCGNFSLMERFIYGGPEAPVLVLCLLGLWLARKETDAAIYLASFVLAAAVTVRPFALMFLVAVWLILLMRRAFGELAISAVVSGLVFGVYLVFIHSSHMASDPIAGYGDDWYGRSPVSFPLWPIVITVARGDEPRTALVKQVAYVLAILGAVVLLVRHFRAVFAKFPVDTLAFALSALFLFSYNSQYVLSEFPRFAVLCMPFACYLIVSRVHMPRWVLWTVCLAVALFSALSTYNVADSIRYLTS